LLVGCPLPPLRVIEYQVVASGMLITLFYFIYKIYVMSQGLVEGSEGVRWQPVLLLIGGNNFFDFSF
jgi:hypothetical protein